MTLNPYQGLKLQEVLKSATKNPVTMTLNPYQGLKLDLAIDDYSKSVCHNDT